MRTHPGMFFGYPSTSVITASALDIIIGRDNSVYRESMDLHVARAFRCVMSMCSNRVAPQAACEAGVSAKQRCCRIALEALGKVSDCPTR